MGGFIFLASLGGIVFFKRPEDRKELADAVRAPVINNLHADLQQEQAALPKKAA